MSAARVPSLRELEDMDPDDRLPFHWQRHAEEFAVAAAYAYDDQRDDPHAIERAKAAAAVSQALSACAHNAMIGRQRR